MLKLTLMQILFLDESGTAPSKAKTKDHPFFVLGGLVVPESDWKSLQVKLQKLKGEYQITGEVKWRYFFPHPHSGKTTPLSHLDISQINELRLKLFAIVASYDSFKVLATVVDTTAYYCEHSDKDAEDMYHDAFEIVCERFQYYLQDIQRSAGEPIYGMVVIDERNNPQNKELDEFHYELLNNSDAKRADFNNLVEGLFIAASHHSVGVQFADLVAGAIYRKVCKNDSVFYDLVSKNIRCKPSGDVNGYGIMSLPYGAFSI